MEQNAPQRAILAGIDDLFFSAKIQAAAKHLGIRVVEASTREALEAKALEIKPDLIILDLEAGACRPLDFIARARGIPACAAVPIVGFFSHVHLELEQAARRAGCEHVLPRSRFSRQLPQILRGLID